MSNGEIFRRLLTSACNVAALAIILLIAPAWALVCFIAWKLAMEFAVWLAMQEGKRGRARWIVAPCVLSAALFARCYAPEKHQTISVVWRGPSSIADIRHEMGRQSQ